MRDSHGEWISRFSRHIGITNSFVAELWRLRDGLLLCSNLNIPFLIVELDAKSIVEIFCNTGYVDDVISPILDVAGCSSPSFSRCNLNIVFESRINVQMHLQG